MTLPHWLPNRAFSNDIVSDFRQNDSRLWRRVFVMYSGHPVTFTGPFFNEKDAELVCLVLPAGCHYAPLESSLRDSTGPIVPKVPQPANREAWLPLSAFPARMCLRDWFPRQRQWTGDVFLLRALLEKAADRVIRECIRLDLSKPFALKFSFYANLVLGHAQHIPISKTFKTCLTYTSHFD